MATENCTSDWELPLEKRRRIISEENPPPMLVSKLGDDLLVEILIRSFPNPRSACPCKLVCKHWSSLISSPCFNRRFVSYHQTMNLLQQPPMPPNPNELQSIILSFLPPMPDRVRDNLKVLDCFEDLVLCGFLDLDCDNGELGRSYLVCNPFTKQWIALPLAPKKSERYYGPVTRLVCEPRISNNLDLGDDQAFAYSEYRFRVVCIYQNFIPFRLVLDVFCSESGEWTKEALARDHHMRIGSKSVSSCNGKLFWLYDDINGENYKCSLAVFDPFRLDIPPTCMDPSAFFGQSTWLISASQGVLHVISYNQSKPLRLIVWRLEQDGKSWKKQCEGLVKEKCVNCGYEPGHCVLPFLHPYNPEIVFFNCSACLSALLYCDLKREELKLFAIQEGEDERVLLKVLEPRVSCWPSLIPRYEELRSLYDGSYDFWVQSSRVDNWGKMFPFIGQEFTGWHQEAIKLFMAGFRKGIEAAEAELGRKVSCLYTDRLREALGNVPGKRVKTETGSF